ncbi:MAG: cytochrome c nitrite reductase small subunit [Spirochaetes bacterium]|nr:MAG: cytochrome c nitrite reductase small subunit [Spirochaetota bacterium]
MNLADRKTRIYLGGTLFAVLLVAAALPAVMKKTSTTEYCASCHVMLPRYEDWFYTGKHTMIRCVDCHLPNDSFLNHYVWKGLDGMKDVVYFYTGIVPEMIHITVHGKKTIQANCVRCHEEMVSRINADAMRCWDCHRSFYHNRINEF